ncbi:MAG: NADH-quinone oxidoreductase subunit N [Anaerolineae bacterium]
MLSEPMLYLLPPLCLLVGALIILIWDAVRAGTAMHRWAWWGALVTALAGLGTTFLLDGESSTRILAVLTYDGFTAYMWRLILVTLILVIMLGESYIRRHIQEAGLFYAILLIFAFGALLLAACVNTVMLLLAVDLLSILGYVLTGFLHYDKRSTEAATKYLVYGSAVSAVMAFGLAWLYGLTGTTDYVGTSQALSGAWAWSSTVEIAPSALLPVLIFVLAGFSFKIGTAPFHQWVPDAFEGAPSPVTAALAIIPKTAGFAALARVTMVMLPDTLELGALWRWPLIAFLAAAAMLIGNLAGLWQENIKRLIAYSGIAQVGYALLGLAIASEFGLTALLFYLTAYALAEVGVFAAITVMSDQVGLDMIVDYRGLYHRAPALAAVLLVSVLSLFGMPGTGGFMAKLWLFTSVLERGRIGLLVVAALNSVLSVAYYWKVIQTTFMHSDHGLEPVTIPLAPRIVLFLSMAGILALGIYPNVVFRWTADAVQVFFGPG